MQASVDLSRVKEELSLEKHSNELKMKHMVSDLEQMTMAKEQTLCIMEEKEATLRAMVKAVKDNSPPEEISKLEGKGINQVVSQWCIMQHVLLVESQQSLTQAMICV